MAGMNNIVDFYKYLMETKSDPRTSEWLLLQSPGPLVTILVTYLYFCVWAGPRFMKDRKPYELRIPIVLYNAIQIGMSMYLVYEGIHGGWFNGYSWSCQPVDYSDDPKARRMASAVWWYFICKISELLDTVFFVLRKKNNQVTFLHLYHHSMMPVCSWIGAKFLPGGHGTLLGLINSFIHIIMYTYYMVASMGPQYQKYLWWKKYLTMMQMIQFCIVCLHNGQVLFRQCDYPKTIAFLLSFQAVFFFYLFAQFFVKAYIAKTRSKVVAMGKPTQDKGVQVNGVQSNGIQVNGLQKNGIKVNAMAAAKTNLTVLNGKMNRMVLNGTMQSIPNGKIKEN